MALYIVVNTTTTTTTILGYLNKMAPVQLFQSDKWQQRWFVLTPTDLSYYLGKDREKKGCISLKYITKVCFRPVSLEMKRMNLLEVYTIREEALSASLEASEKVNRVYLMEAVSQEEGKRWMRAFQRVGIDCIVVLQQLQ